MLGIVTVGVVRESRKFSGHPCNGMYRAHCAVIFAIAQLSCYISEYAPPLMYCTTSLKL